MNVINKALEKCRQTPYKKGEQRHFCIITDKRGRIVSTAQNSYTKTHTLMAKTSKKLGLEKEFCHAEQLALVRARGKGYKLTVVRIHADGTIANSEPCPVCKELIAQSQIKVVEYTI